MTSLVIAEHDNASIKGATLNTVTAALACGGDVHVLVAGANAGAAAAQAAQIAGVTKVIHADGAQFAHGLAENLAAQVLALAGAYSHILFPATAGGKNVAPRVAAKLDVAQISDITKVESADTFERPIYAGNAIATVQSADEVKVITVRTTGFDAAGAGDDGAVAVVVEGVHAARLDVREEAIVVTHRAGHLPVPGDEQLGAAGPLFVADVVAHQLHVIPEGDVQRVARPGGLSSHQRADALALRGAQLFRALHAGRRKQPQQPQQQPQPMNAR